MDAHAHYLRRKEETRSQGRRHPSSDRSLAIAWVLFTFLGVFGAHRIYLGRLVSGLVMCGLTVVVVGLFSLINSILSNIDVNVILMAAMNGDGVGSLNALLSLAVPALAMMLAIGVWNLYDMTQIRKWVHEYDHGVMDSRGGGDDDEFEDESAIVDTGRDPEGRWVPPPLPREASTPKKRR